MIGHLSAATYFNEITDQAITESYSYHAAGAVTAKGLEVGTWPLNAAWAYNSAGQVSSVTYPQANQPSATTLTYSYDAMGRPTGLSSNIASPASLF